MLPRQGAGLVSLPHTCSTTFTITARRIERRNAGTGFLARFAMSEAVFLSIWPAVPVHPDRSASRESIREQKRSAAYLARCSPAISQPARRTPRSTAIRPPWPQRPAGSPRVRIAAWKSALRRIGRQPTAANPRHGGHSKKCPWCRLCRGQKKLLPMFPADRRTASMPEAHQLSAGCGPPRVSAGAPEPDGGALLEGWAACTASELAAGAVTCGLAG